MDVMHTILQPIETEFAIFRKMQDDLAVNPNPLLREIILHVNKQRGKQMRPMMVLLFGKMFGEVSDITYSAALALELLHTGSLVHDDVVDESMQRRGQASVNAIYNNKLAVLVGDYLLSTALVFTGKSNDPRITNIIGALGQTLSDGEIFQMFHSHEKLVSEEIYLEIIRKKTASLFASCASAGAMSVGAPRRRVESMNRFGQMLGMAFQIVDDILDYTPDNNTGKPAANDLQERKITLPLIEVLEKVEPELKAQILSAVERAATDSAAVEFIREQVVKYGGVEAARATLQRFIQRALSELSDLEDTPYRQALMDLCTFVVERDR